MMVNQPPQKVEIRSERPHNCAKHGETGSLWPDQTAGAQTNHQHHADRQKRRPDHNGQRDEEECSVVEVLSHGV